MKQHQMTHKFRDNPSDQPSFLTSPSPSSNLSSHSPNLHSPPPHFTPPRPDTQFTPIILSKSPVSSPITSPPSSEPLSPPFTGGGGVKRPQEDGAAGVSLVDRPPEKRAILCG